MTFQYRMGKSKTGTAMFDSSTCIQAPGGDSDIIAGSRQTSRLCKSVARSHDSRLHKVVGLVVIGAGPELLHAIGGQKENFKFQVNSSIANKFF
jgi:hypothetical protein